MAGYVSRQGNHSSNRVGSTVSRRLSRSGITVLSPSKRHISYGVTVRAVGDHVSVLVDLGVEASNVWTANDVITVVRSWSQAKNILIRTLEGDTVRFVTFQYDASNDK